MQQKVNVLHTFENTSENSDGLGFLKAVKGLLEYNIWA